MIKITQRLFDQFMRARDEADVNMFDRNAIARWANDNEQYDLAVFAGDRENVQAYTDLIRGDFEIVADDDERAQA